jgi:hypothetical protein
MKRCVTVAFVALIAMSLCPVVATAQDQSQTQAQTVTPSRLADAYRGMFVCEKAPGAADILRVPLDLAVRGNEIQFARPLFNPRGTWVLGNELGSGSVDAGGKVQMTSTWEVGSVFGRGNYGGTLTARGGTLSGTQSWHGSQDEARTRSCHIALVPAAHSADTTQVIFH